MTGELTKSYDCPLVINEEQFKNIVSFIEGRLVDIEYKIYTSDGANYSLGARDEVLSYSNPDSRRIVKIVISGNLEHRESLFFKDFSIFLCDMSQFDKSCILSLHNMEEKDIVFFTQRVGEFIDNAKERFWWIHKTVVYVVLSILLYLIVAFLYYTQTDKTQLADRTYNVLFLNGVSVISAFISAFLIRWGVRKLYPEGGFAIGEQVNYFNKLKKNRTLIFITIIGTIVLGVISGLITHLIVS